MGKRSKSILCGILVMGITTGCNDQTKQWIQNKTDYKNRWQRIRYHVKEQKKYRNLSLSLAKRNRELRVQNNKMSFEIQELKAELVYLRGQKKSGKKWSQTHPIKNKFLKRKPAHIEWSSEQAFLLAENEFKRKNYPKAFEYFQSFAQKYPQSKRINDRFLFRTGLSGFESQQYEQAAWYFQQLINVHPKSKLYRSSKLWKGLSHLKMGNKEKFVEIAKEFKLKYQNTPEWKVLREHYENIIQQKS